MKYTAANKGFATAGAKCKSGALSPGSAGFIAG